MKKIIIFAIILVVILIVIIGCLIYKDHKENIKLDATSVTLKENLTIEFAKNAKVSDFIQNLNGTLVNDYEIYTETLGDVKVSFEYINIKNKKRPFEFTIKTIDVNPPKIFSGSSYTVTVGSSKNLTEELLSGDDIDDNPKREIIGNYDFNTVGNYNLTYVVTDSSGNQTKKDFVLYVKEKSNNNEPPPPKEKLEIAEVLNKHKNENTKIGIDVSKWQGDINWQEVKDAGIEFAIIRVGYQTDYDGDYVVDPYFIANINGAKEVGLPVGIYFYSYAKNVNQAIEQANWVKENLKGYDIDLPIAFDWESWNSFNKTGMSFYTINKVANIFLDTLVDAGYKGMLYSSKTYLEDIWYPTKHDTWLAQYNSKATYGGEYSIWQMSSVGKVTGIKGDVDIDIMYMDKKSK